MNDASAPERRICDYEDSPYRRVFWEEADRAYEDQAERLALRAMLPGGERLVEIGAGFGRLVDEYRAYADVTLVDYARSMLTDARARLGEGFTYVCADLYHLPFASQSLDTVVQVRVLHHVEDVPQAFREVRRSLAPGGSYLLEFANKRNVKAVARYLSGAQVENPFDPRPYEFVNLNWNFHPDYIERALTEAGLVLRETRSVSFFRSGALKRRVPASGLAHLDALAGRPLARLALSPSQFVRALRLTGQRRSDRRWRCPRCGREPLEATAEGVPCPGCGAFWPLVEGVYLFRDSAERP